MFLFGLESGFVRDPVPWSLEGFKQVDISETQRPNPQAWLHAQRAELWSPWLPGGGGEGKKKKNWNRSPSIFIFFLFFFAPPPPPRHPATPDQDPLVSGLGLSLFRSICTARASYSRQKLSAPFAFFVLLVPYYIQHGFLWASQKFLLYTSGRYEILVKSLLTVRNGKPQKLGPVVCYFLYIHIYIYICIWKPSLLFGYHV